jgi:hypothetical protein
MIAYVKKYTICLLYLLVFGLCAIVGHIQKKDLNVMKGIATNCVTVIFFTFYTSCFFLCQWAFDNLYRHVKKEDENEKSPIIFYSEKGTSPTNDDSCLHHTFFSKSVMLWYYVYTFGMSVFCVSFCIDQGNLKTSFFFTLGSILCSYTHYAYYYISKKTNGAILFLMVSMGCFYAFSFIIWIYNYHEMLFLRQHEWKFTWIEILAPFFAPFYIISFKKNEKVIGFKRKEGLFFAMPLMAFISMLFITLYLTAHDDSTFFKTDFVGDDAELARYIFINFMAAPVTLFMALVVYLGAFGKREYCLLSSSSQSFVYFLFSLVNANNNEEQVNHNVIVPCCIMTFINFMIAVLLLVVNVYYKEIALENATTSHMPCQNTC